eukprot:459343-Pleurochrysis_carterae.AAC.2
MPLGTLLLLRSRFQQWRSVNAHQTHSLSFPPIKDQANAGTSFLVVRRPARRGRTARRERHRGEDSGHKSCGSGPGCRHPGTPLGRPTRQCQRPRGGQGVGLVGDAVKQVHGLAEGVAEMGGPQPRRPGGGRGSPGQCCPTGCSRTTESSASAHQQHKKRPTPECALVAHLLPQRRGVAANLVGAESPQERAPPALDVVNVGRNVAYVMYAAVDRLPQVHGEGKLAGGAEEL